jgi:cytochrome c oxidase assembly protein subunit 15
MDQERQQTRGQIWLHRFALLTAIATFPLLFVGGLVTSSGAGLAVPDWPTTFGYNMFLFPWSRMVGGIFYEHSHRLIGSVVGLLTIILSAWLWLAERRPWLRWLGVVALAAVLIQGVLGGLRVVLPQHTLAIVHACVAQAFFALMISIALFTSREWRDAPNAIPPEESGRLRRLCLLTSALLYVQVVLGALLRHTGRRLDAHILVAVFVAVHVVLLAVRVFRKHPDQPRLSRPSRVLVGLLIVQLALGVGAYLVRFTGMALAVTPFGQVAVTTTHVVVGSLMLGTSVVLLLRTYRLPDGSKHVVAEGLMAPRAAG